MQLQSQKVLLAQRSAEDVEASVTHNGPDIGPKLDVRYDNITTLTEGEAPRPTHRDILFTLRDGLTASRQNMVARDNDHVESLRKFFEKREERDQVLGGVYDHFSIMRRLIDDQFKDKSPFVIAAIEGPTSRNSDTLIKQANIAIERLYSSEMALPEPRVASIRIDPKAVAEELETKVGALRDKNTELRQCRRAVQKSRKLKNEAIEEHNSTFLWTARTLEGYYQLAGEEELAKLIRPSTRRPGRRAVEVGDDSPDETTSEGATSEEAAAEETASSEAVSEDVATSVPPEADTQPASPTPES